jgi:branched-chain amino acid transport system permease protein
MPLPVAVLTMVVGTILVGLVIERVAYRPLRGAPEVALLLTSFAVGQILQNGVLLLTRLSGRPIQLAFPAPDVLSGVVNIGTFTISKVNLGSFAVGVVVLVLLTLFVSRTRLGLSMHAAAEDLDAARLMGIRIDFVVAVAFAIAAALAAIAGLFYAAQTGQINPYMGFTPVLKAFIAAVIGGFGSLAGAMLGAYVLAFLEVLPTALFGIADIIPEGSIPPEVHDLLAAAFPAHLSGYRDAFVFVFLIVILLFRPNGLLGGRAREETP